MVAKMACDDTYKSKMCVFPLLYMVFRSNHAERYRYVDIAFSIYTTTTIHSWLYMMRIEDSYCVALAMYMQYNSSMHGSFVGRAEHVVVAMALAMVDS
jgi:hypothetical protein